jgi:hypothetical protein
MNYNELPEVTEEVKNKMRVVVHYQYALDDVREILPSLLAIQYTTLEQVQLIAYSLVTYKLIEPTFRVDMLKQPDGTKRYQIAGYKIKLPI